MNDRRYFENIHGIEEIISQLDAGNLTPEEAKKRSETARDLIEECELILNSYSGSIEEISFVPTDA